MAILSCENAAFGYDGRVIIENINLSVDSGDYLCVIGANGVGKTTLIGGLLGLLPPMSGSVKRGGGIGYLPQLSAVQNDFPASAYEVALSGRLPFKRFWPFYTSADKKAARECLERLGVLNLRKKRFYELSGGQQRRVLLARSLCSCDKCIVLDEPTAGLDPSAARELYKLLAELNEQGLAVVMVTHDVENAVRYAKETINLGGDSFD